eukprot:CAMPEP_0202686310 /NCGR_PEP_ID=MMETSP1385-20130828/2127_1 /ASSEMBLY_ACC=CAM_ASM_000861 /TAXON_ID=933848 /ORGANISM="Elphidium margaritaceum" /LENGTH=150 /DNA_ID=CAMNT_0049340863 /DNA_START=47 /DNA_END=496 /DNA_ORIENTATION=+
MSERRAIEDAPTHRWSREWPEFNQTNFSSAYEHGYKAGWKDAYEKAFNSGLEIGISLQNKPTREPLAAISETVMAEHTHSGDEHPQKLTQSQKDRAKLLFGARIKSQKHCIKTGCVPVEYEECGLEAQKERKMHDLKLMHEQKLKKLCHR